MRLVTWNCCRGPFAKKVPLLDELRADIAVVQECARPTVESDQCLWFGDNPRQGIAVVAKGAYRLEKLPTVADVPRYMFPVEVVGAVAFNLLVVWSKGGQDFPYVEGVVRGAELYSDLIRAVPTVLAGDLNSSVIWDATHPKNLNHSALLKSLSDMGLASAYHDFFGEAQGEETRPTHYFHWKEDHPFHIDYCFMPEAWIHDLVHVEVGTYEDWRQHSDHRPLLVEMRWSRKTSGADARVQA